MQETHPIRSLGARQSAMVAGNAATRILTEPTKRSGVLIHNASATLSLWVRLVDQGTAPITITSTNRDYVVPPENTLNIDIGETVEVYLQNSSGASTTSAFAAAEVKR